MRVPAGVAFLLFSGTVLASAHPNMQIGRHLQNQRDSDPLVSVEASSTSATPSSSPTAGANPGLPNAPVISFGVDPNANVVGGIATTASNSAGSLSVNKLFGALALIAIIIA
ncbi:hypothetical protein C8J56DRAFT_1030309 [Mycena floridula]|nr:hypothetical protein C8J56DRAFT_1030309 [Mycena floridula]